MSHSAAFRLKPVRTTLKALIGTSIALSDVSLLLADDDLTRRIFAGGIGIIFSGIAGVLVVAWLIEKSGNFEFVS